MCKLKLFAKLFLAASLIAPASGCGLLPKSECGLTETDGKNILGAGVEAIDKYNPAFGAGAGQSKILRACGYVSVNPGERGYLHWIEGKIGDPELAKSSFETAARPLSETLDYVVDDSVKIGDQSVIAGYRTKSTKEMKIFVRKGGSVFIIAVSKSASAEIPAAEVKSLAERLTDKMLD